MTELKPWDFGHSIFRKKTYHDDLTDYRAHSINKMVSLYPDTLFYANEMNLAPWLDKRLQYDYYYYAVRKMKRYSKWPKKIADKDVQAVQEFFHYNERKARQTLAILNDEQLHDIKQKIEKGGLKR